MKAIRMFLAGFAFLTCVPAAFAASDKAKTIQIPTQWSVSIDASGHVVQLEELSKHLPGFREPLQRAIRSWAFEPGRVDGKPVPTDTTLTLVITLLPTADGSSYAVRVDDALTGGRVAKYTPPKPPRSAVTPGLDAMVVVKVSYDSDGKVVSVEPQPDEGRHSTPALEAATVAAAQHWTFEPERVRGIGIASTEIVPICYLASIGGPSKQECGWTRPGMHSSSGAGIGFALAPAAKLTTDVIGHTL